MAKGDLAIQEAMLLTQNVHVSASGGYGENAMSSGHMTEFVKKQPKITVVLQ